MNDSLSEENARPASESGPTDRITVAELEVRLRAVDPAAFLVLPRILRRVIKQDRHWGGFGLHVPHRKSYTIGGEALLEIVDRSELGLAQDAPLPETVVLLAQPDPRKLADMAAGEALVRVWRLLFHARVHLAMNALAAAGRLGPSDVWRRIVEIGPAAFKASAAVLVQDQWLFFSGDEASTYIELAAVYLELRYFAPSALGRCFPELGDFGAVWRRDIDADRLFEATRLAGAPDPEDRCELVRSLDGAMEEIEPREPQPTAAERPSAKKCRRLMRKALRWAALGNVVRAAIQRAKALRCAPAELTERLASAVRSDVHLLTRRLLAALELGDATPRLWQTSLLALVQQTPHGIWTPEARLLYDLQKTCVDYERKLFTVDLVEWALSRGRRPIKRQLPNQRDVLMLKHLRSAAGRLPSARLSRSDRRQLWLLLGEAQRRVESRLRRHLRPQIDAALDAVGLIAQNLPETVARKKLVEELLDRIGDRGYLTMGDLRDAISRNNLKLPDASDPREFLRGDPLLRADRRLAQSLDGVYRRGEFYLRWMQRLGVLGFGTRLGRLLTRFAAVPFGGAYVALAGMHHVWEMIQGVEHPPIDAEALDAASPRAVDSGAVLISSPVVLCVGLVLLGLINFPSFRRAVGVCFQTAWRLLRAAVVEPVRWLLNWPPLVRFFQSKAFGLAFRFGIKPLLWTAAVWWMLPRRSVHWWNAMLLFLAFNAVLNSRVGRNIEEVLLDELAEGWRRFGLRAITGLFWWIVDLFKALLETVERTMYAVDEWLRFRSGQSAASLGLKAALGTAWFFVAYVLRFCVNVLIEPQINPIKHFPVVTVSHKLLLPLIPTLAGVLELTMDKPLAWTVAGTVITSIPGVFGFLVWELKENWRLFAANRRAQLSPVPVGSHGETVSRLLKPGFHSGTLPKRFAKLRRGERAARSGGSWRAARKHLHAIQHVEAAVRRYVEREFLELFAQSRCWGLPPITLDAARLGTASIRLDFGCAGVEPDAKLRIAFEVVSGRLLAGVSDPGWSDRLTTSQRQVLVTAILGFYKSAGVELVRQQIESQFSAPVPPYDVSYDGLTVWPDDSWDVEVFYNFRDDAWIAPQTIRGLSRRPMPTIPRRRLLFGEVPVGWDDWVLIWNQDLAGQGHPPESVAPVRVLREAPSP